jgi:CHRD domain/PEP-CTERM motif
MMMRTAVLTLLAALALVATPAGHTAVIPFHLTLIGANENPPVASPGTGTADIELDTDLRTLSLDVTFTGLLGLTTAAHIHCCTPPTGNAGVATQVPSFIGFPLGVTTGTFSQDFDMTLASFYNPAFIAAHGGTVDSAFDFLVAGMLTGQTYLNIHSTQFPGGEIRDTLIPEPASLALLGIALASFAAIRRRKQ